MTNEERTKDRAAFAKEVRAMIRKVGDFKIRVHLGVSEKTIDRWGMGVCLPDAYNFNKIRELWKECCEEDSQPSLV